MWLSKNFLFNSKKAVQLIIFVQVLLYFGCKLQIVYVLYRIFHVNKKFILCTYVYPGIRNYRYLQTELGRKPDLWEEGKGKVTGNGSWKENRFLFGANAQPARPNNGDWKWILKGTVSWDCLGACGNFDSLFI